MTRYAKHIIRKSCLLASLMIATGCSTTKLVPDDDHLFVGLKDIQYNNYQKNDHFIDTQEEVEAALATQPNGALFGSPYYRTPFPYGLWIWNYAYGSSGKFKQWLLRSFGKPPVLMSQVNPALRASVAQSVLRKKGYMHGSVTYEEVPQKNPKKMKIAYSVNMDTLFTVDTLTYVNFPPQMLALIDSTRDDASVKPGDPFDVSELDAERTRISELFRNNGYYYYQPGYATYLADTLAVPNRANLRLQLADSLPSEALHPWYVGNLKLNLQRFAREQMTDSIDRKVLKVFWSGGKKRAPISPRVIMRDIKLRPRRAFSYDNYVESVQKINATGVFSSVDLSFTPRDHDTLDLTLNCTFDKPYDFYIEGNIINRTIGRMGPELRLGVTRRNAFRRGEKLDINLHGSYAWQTHSSDDDESTYQYGIDASIEFPRILAPFVSDRPKRDKEGKFKRPKQFFSTPWTIAKISTDVINRPSYYKMHIVSGEWTYKWQPKENTQHEFSPITVNYQFVNSYTDKFLEAMRKNLILASSLRDQFIPKMRYTYVYNSPREKQSPIRWETTIEEAGNVTALYDVLIQGHGWNDKEKTLFKNPYSQFVRLETDLTKTWTLDSKSKLVGHINAGILWSYGNSETGPFSEMFYAGGANSIRAFPVRSIGPGNFPYISNKDAKQYTYLMQNGDSKLVMNLEYRRQLFGNLYGAIFLDAGNVWRSKDYDISEETLDAADEEDAESVETWNKYFTDNRFRLSRFFSRLATGTGIGLRYDLGFLIVRVDWGIALHHPGYTGKSGYFNISGFKDMNTVHLAIGYPF